MNMNKRKMLVVVDMQNDFIDGPLGTPEAAAIVDKVCQKIDDWDGRVLFTMDTHYENYLDTLEGKHIPVMHCLDKTPGWELYPEIKKRRADDSFWVYKETFGSEELFNITNYLDIEEVELVGVCTDICVVSNALLLRTMNPNMKITVDASCCAGTTPEAHEAALLVMKNCCVDIV